jgi:DNA (cytosine-5)-methyltransferase 1
MKAIDLFSGCGGMTLGFMNAGIKVVAAFDNWKTAKEIYELNFDHPFFDGDLMSEQSESQIKNLKFDMIIGGPPCQDFSIAGNRNDNGKRANMTIRFAELVVKNQPEWFVMENVYNITRSKVLPEAIEIFKRGGYGLTYEVLDASYLGVPQARQRFFMIGKLGEEDGFIREEMLSNRSETPLTVKDYFGDRLSLDYYYAHPRSYNRRAIFSVHEPSSTIRGVNRPIPKTYKKHPADKSAPIEGIRALTTKERSMIQTFPEDFKLVGVKTNLEQAIGNAVPVKMAEHIAFAITNYLNK